jgi:hypothetical protein
MSISPVPPRVGRLLVASAVVMFALASLIWTGSLAFLQLQPDSSHLVGGALCVAGLLDLGLGIVMMRQGR